MFAVKVPIQVKLLVKLKVVDKVTLFQFIPVEEVVVAPAVELPLVFIVAVAVDITRVDPVVVTVPAT